MKQSRDRSRGILLSLVVHGGIFLCLIVLGASSRAVLVRHPAPAISFVHVAQLEVAGASHAIKLQLPPDPSAARTRTPVPNTNAADKTVSPVVKTRPQQKAGSGTPPLPHEGEGTGQAATGNGADAENATPAFPIFSPKPPVKERALLPDSEKKIVVDVDVDALGGVVGETLVTGLGNKLDGIVLDTVKSWRFQPATVNGKPVPTQAELIFPFNAQYPITDS